MGSFYKALVPFLPMILLAAGAYLRGRDVNTTGVDDISGRILQDFAPVATANLEGDDRALLKALKTSRAAHDFAIEELERAQPNATVLP